MKPNIKKRLLNYLFRIRNAKDLLELKDEFEFLVDVIFEMKRMEYISEFEYQKVIELATNGQINRSGYISSENKDIFLPK